MLEDHLYVEEDEEIDLDAMAEYIISERESYQEYLDSLQDPLFFIGGF